MLWIPAPPLPPNLANDAVHIYCASLEASVTDKMRQVLADDEHARAARFRFEVDRRRFIVRRAMLRTLLSHYLNVLPEAITFAYSAHNKPYLADHALHFNLSDAQHLALFAFARAPIGIDLEHVHAMPDMDDVAALMFAPAEYALYRALPPEQKVDGFFNCWTRKEAFIKAVGEGLSYPLTDFEVTLKPFEAARVLYIGGDPQASAAWSLFDLRPAAGFRGALAVVGHGWQLSGYTLMTPLMFG